MVNPFSYIMGGQSQPQALNPMQMMMQTVQQFKSNPLGFMASRKMQKQYNIPPNLMNDPDAALQYLVLTGQVSQNELNAAYNNATRAYQQFQNGGGLMNYGR